MTVFPMSSILAALNRITYKTLTLPLFPIFFMNHIIFLTSCTFIMTHVRHSYPNYYISIQVKSLFTISVKLDKLSTWYLKKITDDAKQDTRTVSVTKWDKGWFHKQPNKNWTHLLCDVYFGQTSRKNLVLVIRLDTKKVFPQCSYKKVKINLITVLASSHPKYSDITNIRLIHIYG